MWLNLSLPCPHPACWNVWPSRQSEQSGNSGGERGGQAKGSISTGEFLSTFGKLYRVTMTFSFLSLNFDSSLQHMNNFYGAIRMFRHIFQMIIAIVYLETIQKVCSPQCSYSSWRRKLNQFCNKISNNCWMRLIHPNKVKCISLVVITPFRHWNTLALDCCTKIAWPYILSKHSWDAAHTNQWKTDESLFCDTLYCIMYMVHLTCLQLLDCWTPLFAIHLCLAVLCPYLMPVQKYNVR